MRASGRLAAAVLLALLPTPSPAGAAPAAAVAADAGSDEPTRTSLLFSRHVLDLIEAARGRERPAATPVVRSAPSAPTGSIHLAAIVYHGPHDWRIWLNGESFTPAARPRTLEILEVTAETVVLAWRDGSGGRPTRVELQPNQSYLVASGRIVEGNAGAGP